MEDLDKDGDGVVNVDGKQSLVGHTIHIQFLIELCLNSRVYW